MTIYSILTAGIAIGPLLAGISYDATDSYTTWLRVLIGVGIVGILLFVYAVRAVREPIPGQA
jgi:cyanate permease